MSADSAGDAVGKDSAEAVQSRSIHVLLVDDDTLARHVVRKALEKFGYQGENSYGTNRQCEICLASRGQHSYCAPHLLQIAESIEAPVV